jgi:N-methylhydantoinase B
MWGDCDPRTGRAFFDHGGETNAGWVNAVRGVDGWGALVASNGNLIKASAELNEVLFPHILRGRNYLTDSGGAGQWRGGCGSHFVKEVRTPTSVNQYVVNQYHVHPGIAGGKSGSPDHCTLRVGGPPDEQIVVDPSVAGVRLETGEQLVYEFGGGGGWGHALARDPQAVLEDVWDEYVSIESAARDYGVVITGSLDDCTLALDEHATAKLRAERQASRA